MIITMHSVYSLCGLWVCIAIPTEPASQVITRTKFEKEFNFVPNLGSSLILGFHKRKMPRGDYSKLVVRN